MTYVKLAVTGLFLISGACFVLAQIFGNLNQIVVWGFNWLLYLALMHFTTIAEQNLELLNQALEIKSKLNELQYQLEERNSK